MTDPHGGGRHRRWLRVPLILLSIYLLYAAALFVAQRRIVFPGQSRVASPAPPAIAGAELWRLPLGQDLVEALYLAPPGLARGERAGAVIFLHGNNELIDHWPSRLSQYGEIGLGLLLVEFPGYGRSGGSPSEESLGRVLEAAYDRLLARPDVDPARVVAHGRSLGGGGACLLVRRRPVAALILESSFTGLRAFSWDFGVPGFLVRDPFDNLAAVSGYRGPVLVFHGRLDSLVPHEHGVALAAAARNGRLISFGCGHNDCPPDEQAYWRRIRGFLGGAGFALRVGEGASPSPDQM